MTIPVRAVPGIGPKTAEFLEQNGITTAAALVEAGLEQLCQAPGFHLNRAQAGIDAARQLLGTDTPISESIDEPASEPMKEGKAKSGKQVKGKKKDKKSGKKKTNKDNKDKKTGKKESRKKDKKKGKKKK